MRMSSLELINKYIQMMSTVHIYVDICVRGENNLFVGEYVFFFC